jgi:HSP20 family protein
MEPTTMPRTSDWRRDLTSPLHVIQAELNRLLEGYRYPGRVGTGPAPPTDLGPSAWTPAVDVHETPEEIVVVADLPGVEPDAIDVTVTGSVLTIRGDKAATSPTEGDDPIRERPSGPFHRQVSLSSEVNFEAAQAEARHGVLRIRLPKQESSRTRTIRIQTG